MNRIAAVLVALVISLAAYGQGRDTVTANMIPDIPYASLSKAQRLDLYLPDQGPGPFPVILSVHGGAWLAGDKRDGQKTPMLAGLKRGYAVVSINYRLSQEAQWPAQINDCKAAVRWIRANAAKYRIDPERIAVWGGSAGGHLSALLGTSGGVESLEARSLGNPDQSSRVQAVVDWFGPTDLSRMDEQMKESGVKSQMDHFSPRSPEALLLGKIPNDAPDLAREADPGTYVSADDPPFLIQHGLEDNLVPWQGSLLLARKLGNVLGYEKVSLELFPATGHGGPAFGTEENVDRVFRFLDKTLKPSK